ncbi:clostripain-related cysteine peptidase, partial [Myxococcota bacterium]
GDGLRCDHGEACHGTCCPWGEVCFEGGCCQPLTCGEIENSCGAAPDSCGERLNCGECGGAYETCTDEGRCKRPWTYMRLVAYDSLWGSVGPGMGEVTDIVNYGLGPVGNNGQIHLTLLGDAHGNGGSIYAHVDETGIAVVDVPEINTGAVTTYTDFFAWVVSSYPADRYAISVWGHGGGALSGINPDDTSGDWLDPVEVGQTMSFLADLVGAKIDLVYFTNCVTQMVENLYEVRESVEYVVAGETLTGVWDDVLVIIDESPARDTESIADSTTLRQESTAPGYEKDVVFSSVDTSSVAALSNLINTLAGLLIQVANEGPAQREQILTLVRQTEDMEYFATPSYLGTYVDLHHMCRQLLVLGGDVEAAAREIMDLLSNQLVTQLFIQSDDVGRWVESRGVSIYHPNELPYLDYDPTYDGLDFVVDTQWDEYLRVVLQ